MDEELNPFTGRVIGVVDEGGELIAEPSNGGDYFNLLIDVGQEDDVKVGERVIIFALGPQISSPDDGKPLGHFEVVRGSGRITSVQVRMAVVRSSRTNVVRYQKPQNVNALVAGLSPEFGQREEEAPFRKPRVGDYVRFV
jgi:hypothetical protein